MKDEKTEKLMEIKKLIQEFCERHLKDEYLGYALKLCDKLGRKKTLIITRGKMEIWAASIVYVIARLNFLFDREHEYFITADTICEFFNTKKSTIGNKAIQIEKNCKLGLGAEGFCSPEITDMFTFYETPEGFILPKSAIQNHVIAIDFVEGKEAEELEKRIAEKQRLKERKAEEKRARQAENKRKIAEDKKKEQQETQLNLFDDL